MQQFQAYGQNKGTLVPGQAISVGKYSVQVERYLSQGGFAHVYLVRTATPVYNTTHHVLKRIAVANEAMLTDVKKEVDIMRLLKGHPNIVHLIDAAWHALPTGVFEVFILMEFCPGGGIIDMMNRRLRERLTEAEILQIFVDVCEGVAYMHNSRPALLHRDLKVENILQSSPTSFKLCDFGSATTVSRPPANTQEIRTLEADLNRHTTLQYRAPEMVDPYLRRPIDEKSDVWALGVLLYKLCYYTTPFEEHGPLAILNVQYRIPPYPVYSMQMNSLIGSMLREHGAHRPSVFEVLNQVHTLRGTKSPYQYKIPTPQPLSPRHQTSSKSQAIDQTITYRSGSHMANSAKAPPTPPKNAGVQARDKVLDAIAPMRRGRPPGSSSVPESQSKTEPTTKSPSLASEKPRNWLDDEEKAWKAATTSKSQVTENGKLGDAWSVSGSGKTPAEDKDGGFGDDFGEKLWVEYDPNQKLHSQTTPARAAITPVRTANAMPVPSKPRDAFEGLGLEVSNGNKPPTLGEARKIRTGLASTTTTMNGKSQSGTDGSYFRNTRVTPSPGPSYPTPSRSPVPTTTGTSGSSWKSPPPQSSESTSPESRFPSLEELDKTFGGPSDTAQNLKPSKGINSQPPIIPSSLTSQGLGRTGDTKTGQSSTLRPSPQSYPSHGDGVRSEQVTGIAMRTSQPHQPSGNSNVSSIDMAKGATMSAASSIPSSRPALTRKHRSSMSIKPAHHPPPIADKPVTNNYKQQLPTSSSNLPSSSQKDWLTGDDNGEPPADASTSNDVPRMRESPSKRASFIARSDFKLPEAATVQHDYTLPGTSAPTEPPQSASSTTSFTRATRVFPALDDPSVSSDAAPIAEPDLPSSPEDEGPEDAKGYRRTVPLSSEHSRTPRRKGRQSSVHDLVDLYGGGSVTDVSKSIKEIPKPKPASLDIQKRPSAAVSPPPAKPSPALSGASFSTQLSSSSSQHRKTPSSAAPPPSPGNTRSRPQSMFIFPSKPADGKRELVTPDIPQESPRRVGSRRTSISDVVQRYEALGGVSKTPSSSQPAPPVAAKPVSLRSASHATENDRLAIPDSNSFTPSTKPESPSKELRSESISGLPPRLPGIARASPVGLPRTSPVDSRTYSQESDATRPRRISTKPAVRPGFPSADSSTSVTSVDTIRSGDARSPSPERPYQGVGKLIDQWQKKAADNASGQPAFPKRGVSRGAVGVGRE